MSTEKRPVALTDEQRDALHRLKAQYPHHHVYGGINPVTGKFETFTSTTLHMRTRKLRAGWTLWEVTLG